MKIGITMSETQVGAMAERAAVVGDEQTERLALAALEGRVSYDAVVDLLVDLARNDGRYQGVRL